MPAAPKPHNEEERLDALWSYDLLDTEPESAFDAITALAADICEVPVTLVSLVDDERQWFKSACGLPGVNSTPRDLAFCAHAILQRDILEVFDATTDARFADNPLVTGELAVRFYAGVPLVTASGMALGTLCALGPVPKTLDDRQRHHLRLLADTLVGLIEARVRRSRTDARQLRLLDAALAQAQDRADQLRQLSDFSTVLADASTLDDVLRLALETALKLCNADVGFAATRNGDAWRVCHVHGSIGAGQGGEFSSLSKGDAYFVDIENNTGLSATVVPIGNQEPDASLVLFMKREVLTPADRALLDIVSRQSGFARKLAGYPTVALTYRGSS